MTRLLRSVYTLQITHFITVPAVLALLQNLEAELADAFRTDDFRFLISTAAFLDPNLWSHIEERFGILIVNVYGLTETVCEALYCGPDEATRRIGTVGKPIDCEARIVDDQRKDVAQGEVGELILRGERVVSCVQSSDGAVSVESVARHCARGLSPEKLPNKIFIVDDLPRGPAGKVLLNEIKDHAERAIGEQEAIDSSGSADEQVRRIAARIFKMTVDSVSPRTDPESAPGWNSLGHVEFMLELEKHFGFQMGPREFMLVRSVGDAIQLVEERGAIAGN